ncbi:hypothetical protein O181_069002 [Austropuccinia psidii MF-1]|uniref:Uncharacterized protein n=1 Tax=Austropuccinia psidii MF-1 TaxID=1389203 RepID=A0A9Q3I6U8_9BASI|nr:hypothetical protein [Austropuccinia psidii MF-1]
MPVKKLVQSSQRRGVGNIPKPLAKGQNSYLHIKSFLGQEKTIELLGGLEPIVLQRQGQKDKEIVQKSKSFIHRPEEGTGNDSSFGERGPSGICKLQKWPKTRPKDLRRKREVQRTIKERAKAKPIGTDLTHRGTGSPNSSLQPWAVSSIWPDLSWNSQPKSRKG